MNQAPAHPAQQDFAAALLDPMRPVPPGLQAWNGADPGPRFAVYRNNVVFSLVGVLRDTFPVVRRLVGDACFDAMARLYVRCHPPASPVMTEYGDGLADWIAAFEPAAALPHLADMARLERARVRACHAADAEPLPRESLARALAAPACLPALRLHLHPSVCVLSAAHAVVSLWAAHQAEEPDCEDAIGRVTLQQPESALVLRHDDEVLVLPLPAPDAVLVEQLQRGVGLADALAAAPGADLSTALALLIRHGALVAEPCRGDTP